MAMLEAPKSDRHEAHEAATGNRTPSSRDLAFFMPGMFESSGGLSELRVRALEQSNMVRINRRGNGDEFKKSSQVLKGVLAEMKEVIESSSSTDQLVLSTRAWPTARIEEKRALVSDYCEVLPTEERRLAVLSIPCGKITAINALPGQDASYGPDPWVDMRIQTSADKPIASLTAQPERLGGWFRFELERLEDIAIVNPQQLDGATEQ